MVKAPVWILLVAAGLGACEFNPAPADSGPNPPMDAEVPGEDAGVSLDANDVEDAGDLLDSGLPQDAGDSTDAGLVDGGFAPDARAMEDAEVDVDGGIQVDAETSIDAGPGADAEVEDVGLPDTGLMNDAGFPPDASPPDSGVPDAGPPSPFGATGFQVGGTPGFAGGTVDELFAVAVDPQNRIVAVGSSESPQGRARGLILRYLDNGTLDPSFGGGDGVVLAPDDGPARHFTGMGGGGRADAFYGVTIDGNGRIVVVGRAGLPGDNHKTVVARYLDNGALDLGFGDLDGAGPARVGFVLGQGTGANQDNFSGFSGGSSRPREELNAVTIDAQGRIVTVGRAAEIGLALLFRTLAARFTSDGALDQTFHTTGFHVGRDGQPWQGYYDEFRRVRLKTDGRIVAEGWTGLDDTFNDERTLIVQFTEAGDLDTTGFNVGGTPGYRLSDLQSRAGGTKEVFYGLALDGQERIVAAGFSFLRSSAPIQILTERYLANGLIDTTYNQTGYVVGAVGEITGLDIEAFLAVAIDDQERIVAVGQADAPAPRGIMARYTAQGTLDTTFNPTQIPAAGFVDTWTNGVSEFTGIAQDAFNDVIIDPNQRIVVVGNSGGQTLVVRYQPDGCQDGSGPCAN